METLDLDLADKNVEYFYFHNCLYEQVWKDNRRRRAETLETWDVLHTYPAETTR